MKVQKNFDSFSDLFEYKKSLKFPTQSIFSQYLSKIYTNLLKREDFGNKNPIESHKINIIDNNLSMKTFQEYFDIQEFICERIFKYFNKSRSNRMKKNEFCDGFIELYYGGMEQLIKFCFALADFDNDKIMFKSDMKMILTYIPSKSEFDQKIYIKQINK